MIFGKNAGLMLKYQKAKAKMVEYDVSKQEYPHFPLNSNELSYPTTYGKKCLSPAKKYKLYKSSINKSLHFAQRRLSSSTRG